MGASGCQMAKLKFSVLLLISMPFVTCFTPVKPLTRWRVGNANHFGAPKDYPIDPLNPVIRMGGCSYGEIDPREYPFYNVIAIHPDSPLLKELETNGCGACFELQCIDRKPGRCVNSRHTNNIVVVNSGACSAGCGGPSNTVNLHTFAFDKIAAIKYGNVQVRIRQVECEPFSFLDVRVKDYRAGEGGYIKLTVRNVPGTGGLEKLELRGKPNRVARKHGWYTFDNHFGAAFEMSKLPNPPFDLRLTTTINGKRSQLILRNVIKRAAFTGRIATSKSFAGANIFPRTKGLSTRFQPAGDPVQSPPPTSQTSTLPETPSHEGSLNTTTPDAKPDVDPDDLENFVIFVESDDDER